MKNGQILNNTDRKQLAYFIPYYTARVIFREKPDNKKKIYLFQPNIGKLLLINQDMYCFLKCINGHDSIEKIVNSQFAESSELCSTMFHINKLEKSINKLIELNIIGLK